MSWVSAVTVVASALGGTGGLAGGLAALFKVVVPLMKERRADRAQKECFSATSKADREYKLEIYRTTISQLKDQDLGIEQAKSTVAKQGRSAKALASVKSDEQGTSSAA